MQGANPNTAKHGRKALTYFESQLERDPEDHEARLAAGEAAMLSGQLERSVTLLNEGLRRTGHPLFATHLKRSILALWDYRQQVGHPKGNHPLALLKQVLRIHSKSPQVVKRLLELRRSTQDETLRQDVERFLEWVTDRLSLPARVHFHLGVDAWKRDRLGEALEHMEQAHKLNPDDPSIKHSLAFFLIQQEPPQRNRALRLADEAVRRWPDMAQLRFTRGRVLMSMELWPQAVAALESCLPELSQDEALQQTLQEAQRHLEANTPAENPVEAPAEIPTEAPAEVEAASESPDSPESSAAASAPAPQSGHQANAQQDSAIESLND
jgi:tetratricopeptide (TPR) repeat protein